MDRTPAELGGVGRDLRIDFFRGLALYMIIFDHIPGDPLSKFTYARLGFSDAAEIFVFLSGVSCGIVYSRVLSRQGVSGLLRGVSWRALQIYTYYLIASLVTILLIVVSRDVIAIPDNHQAFIALREDPLAAIQSAIFLVSPPDLPGILVLYLELTLFSIPVFILIAARSSTAALAVSGGLWLLAQIHPDLLPRLADHSYFNPIAWQFIFCIGMFVGTWYNSDEMSWRFSANALGCYWRALSWESDFFISLRGSSTHSPVLEFGHARSVGRNAVPDEREPVCDPPAALSQRRLPRGHLRQTEQPNPELARRGSHHQERQVLASGFLPGRDPEPSCSICSLPSNDLAALNG